jgi:hypothetical protein
LIEFMTVSRLSFSIGELGAMAASRRNRLSKSAFVTITASQIRALQGQLCLFLMFIVALAREAGRHSMPAGLQRREIGSHKVVKAF